MAMIAARAPGHACTSSHRRCVTASASQLPGVPSAPVRAVPTSRRALVAGLALAPAIGLLLADQAQAYDLEKAKAEKEERKAKLAEAAQEAKQDGKAVETDSLQSERTVPEGQIKSVRT